MTAPTAAWVKSFRCTIWKRKTHTTEYTMVWDKVLIHIQIVRVLLNVFDTEIYPFTGK